MDPMTIALGLAQIAPNLLRLLGAAEKPVELATKAAKIAQTVTGKATPQEALQQLQQNAEQAHQFRMALVAADTELERLYLGDRANARARDVELVHAGQRNTRADVMVAGATLGLITCLVVLVWYRNGLPGEAVGIISTVAGIFGACLRDAFQFEFGSSRGSREKDQVIATLGRTGDAP